MITWPSWRRWRAPLLLTLVLVSFRVAFADQVGTALAASRPVTR